MDGVISLLLRVPSWGPQGSCLLHLTMTVTAKNTVLCCVTPCSFLGGYKCSEEQSAYQSARRHITESNNVKWYTLLFLVLNSPKNMNTLWSKVEMREVWFSEGGKTDETCNMHWSIRRNPHLLNESHKIMELFIKSNFCTLLCILSHIVTLTPMSFGIHWCCLHEVQSYCSFFWTHSNGDSI